MAWFIPIALAAIQAGTAIYQGIKGAKQKREARALQQVADEQERSNLSEARRLALVGMPDAQYERARRNIDRNMSLGLSALRDRRSALAGVANIQQNSNDAMLALNAEDARQRRSAEFSALNQANRLAGITGGQAAERLASGQALTGAAIQNFANIPSTLATYYGGSNGFDSDGSTTSSTARSNGISSTKNFGLNSSLFGKSGYRGLNANAYAKPY